MVQILKKKPSFAQELGRGVGQGVGSTVDRASQISLQREEKKQQDQSKHLSNLSSTIAKELKNRRLESEGADPKYVKDFYEKAKKMVQEGHHPVEAVDQILADLEREQGPKEKDNSFASAFIKKPKEPFDISVALQKMLHPFTQEDPGIRLMTQHPGKAAASTALGTVGWGQDLADLGTQLGSKFIQKPKEPFSVKKLFGGSNSPEDIQRLQDRQQRKPLISQGREAIREGLSDDEIKAADKLELIGSLIPIESVLASASRGSRAAKESLQKLIGYSPKAGAEGVGIARAAEELGASERSLAGRVHRQPETATEMRIARAEPKSKMHQTPKQIEIREAQLKKFPQYVQEIEADAAKRALQAEARIPKTDKGRMSQQMRMHEAEKAFEPAREAYHKSLSRVRELERQMARRPAVQRQEMQEIVSMAKEELKEAEFAFKQATENLKGINYRATIPEMREAARNKIMGIQDAISAGEEYKLAKMDYSPDLINEAKRISKNKPLPRVKESDFYNSVHEHYANEYKARIGQIDKELSALKKQAPNMGTVQKLHQLQEEKGILSKMVESAEAEQTIHRHKFGLREMSERKKGAERMAHFQKVQDSPKIREAAQQKMWKRRITKLGSEEGRSSVAREMIDDAVLEAKSPKQAERILAEEGRLKESLDNLKGKSEKLSEKLKDLPDPKNAKEFGERIAADILELKEWFTKGHPALLKTRIGKDAAIGISAAIVDDVLKENDVPLTGASVIAAIQGGVRSGVYRVIANQLTKWALKSFHVRNAKKAYETHDNEKLRTFKPAIKKKAREKLYG